MAVRKDEEPLEQHTCISCLDLQLDEDTQCVEENNG